MNDGTLYRMIALAAGLRSIGHDRIDQYVDQLIDCCDFTRLQHDPSAFIRFLRAHKSLAFIPLLSEELAGCDLPGLWELHSTLDRISKYRLSLLEPVFPALQKAGVDVMPYKGIDLHYSFPNVAGVRFMWDADPLVPRDQIEIAGAVLRENGLSQAFVDRERLNDERSGPRMMSIPLSEVEWVLNNHHETHPYISYSSPDWLQEHLEVIEAYNIDPIIEGRAYLEVNVDLHHSIASGFAQSDIWPGSRKVKLSGPEIYSGLGVEAYLCLYMGRTYNITHVLHDSSIQTLFDTARILCHAEVNWELLRDLVDRYRLLGPAFHVLAEVAEMTADASVVPAEELEHYAESLRKDRAYDLGPLAPKLLHVVTPQTVLDVTK